MKVVSISLPFQRNTRLELTDLHWFVELSYRRQA